MGERKKILALFAHPRMQASIVQNAMLKVIDDPPFVEALMARCVEYQVAYGRALADVGADMLSGGDSPVVLLGPELYARLALPFETRVIAALKATTGKPISLHNCGNAMPILAAMARSGADVLELDHFVDLRQACRIVGPDITLWGNLDPVGVLAQGTPEHVEQVACEAIEAVKAAGHRRFVLSSGCTLAVETPAESLEALSRAARSSSMESRRCSG